MLCNRKQNSLWAEGDVFQEKMLNERENGKMAVTRILSGVDDISINGSNKNRALKKEDVDLVSFGCDSFTEASVGPHTDAPLYDAPVLLYSIMMKRSEMVSHREINCAP